MFCSDMKLRRQYFAYNRKFWGGELPQNTVVMWMPLTDDRLAETEKVAGVFVIRLCPLIAASRNVWMWHLLHEMVHVRLWPRDCRKGKLWKAEVIRLMEAGAWRLF